MLPYLGRCAAHRGMPTRALWFRGRSDGSLTLSVPQVTRRIRLAAVRVRGGRHQLLIDRPNPHSPGQLGIDLGEEHPPVRGVADRVDREVERGEGGTVK